MGLIFPVAQIQRCIKRSRAPWGKVFTCSAGDPGSIPKLERSAGDGISYTLQYSWASLVAQLVKNPPATWETWVWSLGSTPGFGRSPGEEKGYLLQYSGLENSMGCIVHGVTKSQRQLSNFHFQRGQSVLKNDQLRTQIFWHNEITNVCPKFFHLPQRYYLQVILCSKLSFGMCILYTF